MTETVFLPPQYAEMTYMLATSKMHEMKIPALSLWGSTLTSSQAQARVSYLKGHTSHTELWCIMTISSCLPTLVTSHAVLSLPSPAPFSLLSAPLGTRYHNWMHEDLLLAQSSQCCGSNPNLLQRLWWDGIIFQRESGLTVRNLTPSQGLRQPGCARCCISGCQPMPATRLQHLVLYVQVAAVSTWNTHRRGHCTSVHMCVCVCVCRLFQLHRTAVSALINFSSCCLLQPVPGRKRELPADTDSSWQRDQWDSCNKHSGKAHF